MNKNPMNSFENKVIRTLWNEEDEEWYFSIVDVVGALTEQETQRSASTYWAVLKKRIVEESKNELLTNCKQLKMKSTDGKMRLTDVANTEQLLRIIQSIPSKKAEPFKLWLAEVGKDRIEETIDPELTIDRALETYVKKGYSKEWINQRLQAIQVRKELTDEWQNKGVKKGIEFAILTDEITKAWSGMTTRRYKNLKGLTKENLRDNMTTTEIILNMLAETATKEISKQENPNTFDENKKIAKRGGNIAGNARKELEKEIGHSVISEKNATELHPTEINSIVIDLIEETSKLSTKTKEET
ncbi:MAG: BRO family protein [Treponemataceae bacterium]|nr:BRO family protein [Treponemataceae bacterium]